jgi:DNA-binding response OmpR family regulator
LKEARVRILIVEDEPKVAAALRQGLESESYSVSVANNGEEGFFLASSERFDLIILDIMLPRRSGIEILSAMRERGIIIPVLLLTARDAVEDRVLGLDSGADDYLVKPFAIGNTITRIRWSPRVASWKSALRTGAYSIAMNCLELVFWAECLNPEKVWTPIRRVPSVYPTARSFAW